MFTGLIQCVGTVASRSLLGGSVRFTVTAPEIASLLKVGDSIACEGACLTAETVNATGFSVCAVAETLAKTTLSDWQPGKRINLETSLTPSTPMGGHFVLGHVDGLARVESFVAVPGGGKTLTVRLPDAFAKYCVYKGSITLAGVSLTIASVENASVSVALIPHTLVNTTLGELRPGSNLHFEADILAKYTERLLARDQKTSSLTTAGLSQWGYTGSQSIGESHNGSAAS